MTPRPNLNTYTFDQLKGLIQSPGSFRQPFHLFGVFIREDQVKTNVLWVLKDDTISGDVQIKICGDISQYVRPEPGDIIRIHRAKIDNASQMIVCLSHKNVVLWKAYRYRSGPQSTASNPTITQADEDRRCALELYHASSFTPIKKIAIDSQNNSKYLYPSVCGRVEGINRDDFQNILLSIHDGSASICIRVFPKKTEFEDNRHFAIALELSVGDYMVSTNTKVNFKPFLLNLSASTAYGRSLRKVEQSSILGVHLTSELKDVPIPVPDPQTESNSPLSSQNSSNPNSSSQPLRRSTRLLGRQAPESEVAPPLAKKIATTDPVVEPKSPTLNHSCTLNSSTVNTDNSTPITRLCDIKFNDGLRYKYCNIVGQVRSLPRLSRFGNLIFQIYDGTKPSLPSEFAEEIPDPMPDCATVIAYCPQAAQDTTEHYNKVQKLVEGDLVKIINLKVLKRNDKIRLELQANKTHDKSIEVIDKNSEDGIKILDIVQNPLVEELMEDYLYSTPPTETSDST